MRTSLLVLLAACHDSSAPPAERSAAEPVVEPVAAAPVAAAVAPTLASAWIETLEAAREPTDFACPPVGAAGPRPVVIALHGMDARPEWVCNDFHATFGPWPWVICPRGDAPTRQNWSWGSTASMRKAIQRVLARITQRWPSYVSDEGRVFVTYSLSASMAPGLLADPAATTFASAFFLEGFSKHLPMYAPAIARRGLQRAVFFARLAIAPRPSAPRRLSRRPGSRRCRATAAHSATGSRRRPCPPCDWACLTPCTISSAGPTIPDRPDLCSARRGANACGLRSWLRTAGTA